MQVCTWCIMTCYADPIILSLPLISTYCSIRMCVTGISSCVQDVRESSHLRAHRSRKDERRNVVASPGKDRSAIPYLIAYAVQQKNTIIITHTRSGMRSVIHCSTVRKLEEPCALSDTLPPQMVVYAFTPFETSSDKILV